ncbi:DUF3102 domain-containing protein [Desulfitobacterium hafniense]|uniref:Protein export cytoplasm protein SecA ATPase RNA helicase n=3 Tax=Desulfitobacterium hafniense TaxID=49338 RepID=Q250E1_DESHY|nr:DUF3102 domain-containing protein [Desulfitobacterium hafniense]ACL18577.1 hypothetical protein Dhaf_0510 [Desulfitobacterium hafniense DCB-2]KTE90939.1 hypothetical protein AT727_23025 [Desulfitobacterium hafniense]BAE82351.1 hypothetical protein DSY0562 [Desulfitobacterium hafniense Y51]
MDDLLTERTPLLIATEINTIKQQTGKILLASAIEVGRRLREAKELLPYGEWTEWLEESVSYTERTAQNLMRIFDAYGSQQIPPAGAVSRKAGALNSGSPTSEDQVQKQGPPPNLNYTQALLLLGVPEEERFQLMEELDLESMTTRELEKAIQERKQAAAERDQALQENAELQKTVEERDSRVTHLTKERDGLKKKAEELAGAKTKEEAKVEKLSMDLESKKQSTSAKAIDRMSRNLDAAYHKAKANRIAFLYESMERNFRELRHELKEFAAKEPETYEVYRDKVMDFLTKGMKEKL